VDLDAALWAASSALGLFARPCSNWSKAISQGFDPVGLDVEQLAFTSRSAPLRHSDRALVRPAINRQWPAIRAADPAIRSSKKTPWLRLLLKCNSNSSKRCCWWRWLLPLLRSSWSKLTLLERFLLGKRSSAGHAEARWPSHQPADNAAKGEKQCKTHQARGPGGRRRCLPTVRRGAMLNSFAPESAAWRPG